MGLTPEEKKLISRRIDLERIKTCNDWVLDYYIEEAEEAVSVYDERILWIKQCYLPQLAEEKASRGVLAVVTTETGKE